MSQAIDIHADVFSICDKLGLDGKRVFRLTIEPRSATAIVDVYLANEHGAIHLDPTTQDVARDQLTFEITT